MKEGVFMYRLRLRIATFGIAILICSGQTFAQSQPDRDTKQSGTYQTGTSQANPTTFKDKLIEMNYAEIQLGHLALMKAQNSSVRDFAEMVVSDQTKVLSRLQGMQTSSTSSSTTDSQADPTQSDTTDQTQIAGREKPDMPDTVDGSKLTRQHQETVDRLKQLSESQFDR